VGGFITPPQEYFQIIERIVRIHGGAFISDEVQTGWGRTGGNWFRHQYGVVPDILTRPRVWRTAAPSGLALAKPQVAAELTGLTISTFGGNSVTYRRQGRSRFH
jgi:4-aminobutyrate aminotransferase-like enzyme